MIFNIETALVDRDDTSRWLAIVLVQDGACAVLYTSTALDNAIALYDVPPETLTECSYDAQLPFGAYAVRFSFHTRRTSWEHEEYDLEVDAEFVRAATGEEIRRYREGNYVFDFEHAEEPPCP